MIARRIITIASLLGVVSVIAFLLPQLTGIDPARAVIRSRTAEVAPDQQTVDRVAHELGLDRALPARYLRFLRDLFTGQLGDSYASRTPVAPQLRQALSVSLTLVGLALLVAIAIGVAAGAVAALRAGRALDHLVTLLNRVVVAVPEFVLAPVLVLVFAVQLHWVHATGWGSWREAVLPVLTIAAFPAALLAQTLRAELLEVLAQPWVRAARANGIPERRIVRHALRSAAGAMTAIVSLFVPGLLGGAVVTEVIFAVPGLGSQLYGSVLQSDVPVAQAGFMAIMLIAIAVSLLADAVRRVLDPRVRSGALR